MRLGDHDSTDSMEYKVIFFFSVLPHIFTCATTVKIILILIFKRSERQKIKTVYIVSTSLVMSCIETLAQQENSSTDCPAA